MATAAAHTTQTWRFGVFEVDAQAGELRRAGIQIKLRDQCFRILILLLEHEGQIVTREDLRGALWSSDTFVDFDHSLNAAVMKLREALGDTAEKPLYIETIPKRGYRFIAPVAAEVESSAARASEQQLRSRGRNRYWWFAAGAAGGLIAIAAGVWYVRTSLPVPRVTQVRQLTNDVRWMRKTPIGTDGSRVYLELEFFNFNHSFGQVPVGGGEVSSIPVELKGGNAFLTGDVSPNGLNTLLWSGSAPKPTPVWVVGTSGSPVRYLADADFATWWPDSIQVLCLTPAGELRLMPVDGGDSRLLVRIQPGSSNVSVSPDGKLVRYDFDWKLWEVGIGESRPRELLGDMRGSAQKCCGRWSPDGAFYTFLSAKSPATTPLRGGFQVWLLDERRKGIWRPNSEPIQLTLDPLQWVDPVFSHDSRTIFAGGTLYQGELVRYDKSKGRFERFLKGVSAEWVEFSPDGRSVAYAGFPDHTVWRANRDGSGAVQLAHPEGTPIAIHWSPDGRQIVFAEYFTGSNFGRRDRVYVVPASGGNPVEIPLDGTQASGCDPTWSADGRSLAYTANPANRLGGSEIRVYNLETHQSIILPHSPKPPFSPRWSPDGRYIFCLSLPGGEIEIFDVVSKKWRLFPRSVGFPTWSRDSRSVTFVADEGGPNIFYRMSIPSAAVVPVASLNDLRTTGSVNHSWFGTDPDGAPLFLRDAGTFEIYALSLERQ